MSVFKPALALPAIILISLAVAAAQFHLIPEAWLFPFDRIPIKFALSLFSFLFFVLIALSVYRLLVIPSARRVILELVWLNFALGSTLSLAPWGIAALQSAEIKGQMKIQENRVDKGFESIDIEARLKMFEDRSADISRRFYSMTIIGLIAFALLYGLADGIQAMWNSRRVRR